MMLRVLIINKNYLPGYRAGGPIRSLSGMVERISSICWRVVARDRDFGDSQPYPGVDQGRWHEVGNAEVMYVRPGWRGINGIWRAIAAGAHDVLYLNSAFSPVYTTVPLVLMRLGLLARRPVVLAPRGEFSPGALSLGRVRKKLFLSFARFLGLYRGITWHATSPGEAEDIRSTIGSRAQVLIAPNISAAVDTRSLTTVVRPHVKTAGHLRIVFLSRISPKKNLRFALECCRALRGDVEFDIFGAITDERYWSECEAVIKAMPPNVMVRQHGAIPHEEVVGRLATSDVFFLPTLGENFGHVVAEAFAAGLPVLLSDQTPWRGLKERGVGWDLPLDDYKSFESVLQNLVDMGDEEWSEISRRAREYSSISANIEEAVKAHVKLFLNGRDEIRNLEKASAI